MPKEIKPGWTLFPNPSYAGQNLELGYLGKEKISGGKVKLRLLNTTGELREKNSSTPHNFKVHNKFVFWLSSSWILYSGSTVEQSL